MFGVGRHHKLGNDGRDLDPVSVVRPSLAELVDQPDHVFSILGSLEAEKTIGAERVVGAEHRPRALLGEIHHRVERRPNSPGVALDVEDLALGGLEYEVIDVAGLLDHAIKRHRGLKYRGVGLVVIRLRLDHVAERR